MKFHGIDFITQNWPKLVSVAHDTVMGICTFFGLPKEKASAQNTNENSNVFGEDCEYLYHHELFDTSEEHPCGSQFALIQFETPILAPPAALVIGSKLDTDVRIHPSI